MIMRRTTVVNSNSIDASDNDIDNDNNSDNSPLIVATRSSSSSGSGSNSSSSFDNDNDTMSSSSGHAVPIRRRAAGGANSGNSSNNNNNSGSGNIPSSSSSTTTTTTMSDKLKNKKYKSIRTAIVVASIRTTMVMALCLFGFMTIWDKGTNMVNDDHQSGKNSPSSHSHSHKSTSSKHLLRRQNENSHNKKTSKSVTSSTNEKRPTSKAVDVVEKGTSQHECGIWMAPSSIRPYPGYGIYTTRYIPYDDYILHGPDAVAIPLHDMRRYKKGNEKLPFHEERRKIWRNVFSNVRLWFSLV
jgi:hypothetical protein